MQKYDAIVIGAGQAGGPLAKKLATAGQKVALIEKRWVGGTCVNDGCTPTKTWVASARAAYLAQNSGHIGVKVKNVKIDMRQIKKRKDEIVSHSRNGNQKAIEATKNLDLIFGEATFLGNKTISIKLNNGSEQEIKADRFFINTGAKPIIPEIEGLKEIDYLDSTSILELDDVPDHLHVIGANYIGMEFGQMFHRFGSKVTLIERSARVLGREDEDIAAAMHQILTDEGLEIITNAQATKFSNTAKGKIKVTVKAGDKTQNIKCSHVLIAIGRAPQTEVLNLQRTK